MQYWYKACDIVLSEGGIKHHATGRWQGWCRKDDGRTLNLIFIAEYTCLNRNILFRQVALLVSLMSSL